ncbi:MAG: hypothetical protein M1608_10640, partial [Candidatus Omnitrophica bacterium]|nr:hypothetical protein [Candidatus Omnitrophota bacterium]
AVSPTITKSAGSSVTTLSYSPPEGLIPEATNIMRVVFGDNATPPQVQTVDFSFEVISVRKAAQIVNIDINGTGRSARPPGATYVGQGAAGGGSVFNGITASSKLPDTVYPDGPFDDNITILGTNLVNSLGQPSTVSFTIGPVCAADSGATPGQFSDNYAALNQDWILVGYLGQTSRTADFTIDGLSDAPIANLYFYTRLDPRDNNRFSCGTYIIPGTTGPEPFPGRGVFINDVTFFRNVPVVNGKISGTFTNTSVLALMSGLTVELPLPQPYVKSFGPTGTGLSSTTPVQINLQDFVSQVVPGSIQLSINGQTVTPTVNKSGDLTTITYLPTGGWPQGATINVKLVFGDTATPQNVQTQEYSFDVLDEAKAAKIINIDINGHRTGNPDPTTYVGMGAAGGGTVFNGLSAESALPDGTDDDFITVTGTNLKDSLGNPTTVGFTISPVAGGNSVTDQGVSADMAPLLGDWVLVAYFGQAPTDSANFVISGLGSATNANLYFYSRGDWPGGYTIGDESPVTFTAATGGFTAGNTIYFKAVPVTDGQITGNFHGIPNAPNLGILSGLTIDLNPAEVAPPGPLSISMQANQVAISWTGAGTLQSADAVTGPWSDVTDASSPYLVSPSGNQKFYRLRQ